MGKIAYVFPGQGSQYVGMMHAFYREFPQASDVFHTAEEALRMSLPDFLEVIFRGPAEKLDSTVYTQPALLTASYAVFRVMEEAGFPKPDYTAGHSLGEITALLSAGGLDLTSAVRLTYDRGKFMQSAVPEGKGAMAAILRISPEEVEDICREAQRFGVVEPANYNSPVQTVVSGERAAVEKASEIARERGARVVPLKVSVPSHCSLMKPAAEAFRIRLSQTPIKNVRTPLVQNCTAQEHIAASEIRENLYRQLFSPVRWYQGVEFMASRGVDTFVEIGPKSVLSRLIQQTVRGVRVFNLEEPEDIEKVLREL